MSQMMKNSEAETTEYFISIYSLNTYHLCILVYDSLSADNIYLVLSQLIFVKNSFIIIILSAETLFILKVWV